MQSCLYTKITKRQNDQRGDHLAGAFIKSAQRSKMRLIEIRGIHNSSWFAELAWPTNVGNFTIWNPVNSIHTLKSASSLLLSFEV